MTAKLEEAMQMIHQRLPNFKAKVGMILGSGLSPVADEIMQSCDNSLSIYSGFTHRQGLRASFAFSDGAYE